MSKHQKLLQRLFSVPSPKDFSWEELIAVMNKKGFKESCTSGSHYTFEHKESGFRCRISKTHPSGLLKQYQINTAKEAINAVTEETGGKL